MKKCRNCLWFYGHSQINVKEYSKGTIGAKKEEIKELNLIGYFCRRTSWNPLNGQNSLNYDSEACPEFNDCHKAIE